MPWLPTRPARTRKSTMSNERRSTLISRRFNRISTLCTRKSKRIVPTRLRRYDLIRKERARRHSPISFLSIRLPSSKNSTRSNVRSLSCWVVTPRNWWRENYRNKRIWSRSQPYVRNRAIWTPAYHRFWINTELTFRWTWFLLFVSLLFTSSFSRRLASCFIRVLPTLLLCFCFSSVGWTTCDWPMKHLRWLFSKTYPLRWTFVGQDHCSKSNVRDLSREFYWID